MALSMVDKLVGLVVVSGLKGAPFSRTSLKERFGAEFAQRTITMAWDQLRIFFKYANKSADGNFRLKKKRLTAEGLPYLVEAIVLAYLKFNQGKPVQVWYLRLVVAPYWRKESEWNQSLWRVVQELEQKGEIKAGPRGEDPDQRFIRLNLEA